jgi:hypothetical protein
MLLHYEVLVYQELGEYFESTIVIINDFLI